MAVMKDPLSRSFEPITKADLRRLLTLARLDRRIFFADYPEWAALYRDRVLGTAICQGAALHYIRGDVIINDFDVYTFYSAHPQRAWYSKRL